MSKFIKFRSLSAKNQIYFYDFRQAVLWIFLHLAVIDSREGISHSRSHCPVLFFRENHTWKSPLFCVLLKFASRCNRVGAWSTFSYSTVDNRFIIKSERSKQWNIFRLYFSSLPTLFIILKLNNLIEESTSVTSLIIWRN